MLLGEVGRPVIDGSVCAQSHARSALLVVAGGGVGARPELARELNGRDADTAAATVHQHGLAACETPMDEQVGPDREVRFGQGRGPDRVVAPWPGQALRYWRSAVLSVSAPIRERAHTVADREALRFTPKRDHFACHLEPDDRARPGRRRVQSFALRNVGTVHACGLHPDQDFVGSGLRHGRRADRQDFGSAGGSRGNVAHGLRNHVESVSQVFERQARGNSGTRCDVNAAIFPVANTPRDGQAARGVPSRNQSTVAPSGAPGFARCRCVCRGHC